MERQTAVEWFYQRILAEDIKEVFEQAKEIEKQQMKDAVLYGLDEDGHTGDWKISVAENYYIKTYTK
jgi:6-phosphogluconolactonase/glucosamine-6-phosphate isomerase/deaminase